MHPYCKVLVPYTAVGGELSEGTGENKTAVSSAWLLKTDGTVRYASCYNIDGNNYFKLRDLGEVYGFGVDYDATANAAVITTNP
jgi:hypothetical protein